MGQVRHGSATPTVAVRSAVQRLQAPLAQLSGELRVTAKTVATWRKRATVEDLKTGPRVPHSTVLTEAEEAMVVAFRRHTLLPPDRQLRLAVKTLGLLAGHGPAFRAQQHMQPAIAEPPTLVGQLAKPMAQIGAGEAPASVADRAPVR